MKLMQSQSKNKERNKEKFDFLCCKICSIYQLSDLCKNYEKIYHYIALHLLTFIKSGRNKTISINIFGERKRKREQLHYKLYCDIMVAALCLVFRCKLLISCRHFSYVCLEFWFVSSLPFGFIEACVFFWQSCKKRSKEIEVGNMNPKNNNMKCSTAD